MITGAQHDERMALRDRFRDVLTAATKQRRTLTGVIQTADGPELEWVIHERVQMLHTVNAVRNGRGLPPALFADIERVDRLATGHCDWLDKFSFYCAELATTDMRS